MDWEDLNTNVIGEMTVLIVDDDKLIRDIIMANLRGMGFQRFLYASNGVEANKKLQDSKNEVSLIMCDWDMPVADGLIFLRAVRADEKFKKTPFIMVTAQQSTERLKISQAAKYNVDAYIVKPFNAETLRKKVAQVLFGERTNSKQSA